MKKVQLLQQGKQFWLTIQEGDKEPVYIKVTKENVKYYQDQLNLEIIKA